MPGLVTPHPGKKGHQATLLFPGGDIEEEAPTRVAAGTTDRALVGATFRDEVMCEKTPSQRKPCDFSYSRLASRMRRSPIRASVMAALDKRRKGEPIAMLAGGLPSPDTFPFAAITVSLKKEAKTQEEEEQTVTASGQLLKDACQYHPGLGLVSLRETLSKVLKLPFNTQAFDKTMRSDISKEDDLEDIKTYAAERVCLTCGGTDGLVKVIELLTDEGDEIFVEEFSWAGFLALARTRGRECVPCGVDDRGLKPSALDLMLAKNPPSAGKKTRLLYTTPCGQNPTGVTVDAERKRQIYEICRQRDVIILEDDPYGWLDLDADPNGAVVKSTPPGYYSMDVDGRVIRLDSTAKILAPGMRLGWAQGPKQFIEKMGLLAEASTQFPSGFSQSSLCALFEEWGENGLFEHLTGLRAEYKRRRDFLLDALEKAFANVETKLTKKNGRRLASWNRPSHGMFLWLEQFAVPDASTLPWLEYGVACVPGKYFKPNPDDGRACPFVRLTFATATDDELTDAAERIARVIADASENNTIPASSAAPPPPPNEETSATTTNGHHK